MCSTKTFTVTFQFFAIILCMILAAQNTVASKLKKVEPDFRNYRLGRFLLSVPVEMKQAATKYVVHYTEFEEFLWKDQNNHKSEIDAIWKGRLQAIKARRAPHSIEDIVIETMDFSHRDRWAKGIFYYGDSDDEDAGYWDILLDTGGEVGVWIKVIGTVDKAENLREHVKTVVQAYQGPSSGSKVVPLVNSGFYLDYGVVKLPYKYKEQVYTRFEGHELDPYLKLEVEINVTAKVDETNLIENLNAALTADYAPGVSVDKIRTEHRTVDGLSGDEVILRGKEDGDSNLSFSWRYPGKKKSATSPEILISMETKDKDLDAKLALWENILDALQPIPQ